MLAKLTVAGVAGSMLLATVAFAQTQTPAADAPAATTDKAGVKSEMSTSHQGEWRASKMVGLNVYNDKNESVGSISDMLTDKSGTIKAVVIGVGGFLGMGEHDIAVSMDKLKFVETPVRTSSTAPTGTAPTGTVRDTTTGTATAPANTTTTTTTARNADANDWTPDHAVMSGTKDQLKAMPQFKYSDYN
jgi:sporulation protein YlmC with PRC-barrel domain